MNKETYLTELSTLLIDLPETERNNILSDCDSHFQKALTNGKTMQDIISIFGSPKQAAAEIKAEWLGAIPHPSDPVTTRTMASATTAEQLLYGEIPQSAYSQATTLEIGTAGVHSSSAATPTAGVQPSDSQSTSPRSSINLTRSVLTTTGLFLFNTIFVMGPFLAVAGTLLGLFVTAVAFVLSPIALFYPVFPLDLVQIAMPDAIFIALILTGAGLLLGGGLMHLGRFFFRITVGYLQLNLRMIKGD
ncbi:HAAS signaling domain-containing protein [Brevibacillus dissolubilis]|uniref:HAAS signaling domain-containing protein n=1 Tax=Brevibacillus dissolubilis TaxID=1844116 RepID=UPI001116FC29|nr:DUF1700 domain-containing protein [Brevibacillus dissolubilis]